MKATSEEENESLEQDFIYVQKERQKDECGESHIFLINMKEVMT
jgi:hypothetical protein